MGILRISVYIVLSSVSLVNKMLMVFQLKILYADCSFTSAIHYLLFLHLHVVNEAGNSGRFVK